MKCCEFAHGICVSACVNTRVSSTLRPTMKHLSLLFCLTLFAWAAPAPQARADISVPIDFFYDALSPHGDWVYTDTYGYVWQPGLAQQDEWAPYADGNWAYTDAGWTWISNEDFGWATYHYGRWIRMSGGWFWVPGNEWAPSWVSWRQADDYVGWAPLPPEASWSQNIGFSSWTDSYYDIGPSYYNFVPVRSFATQQSLRPFIMDRRQNAVYVDRSVNITNISYRQNVVNNIFVGGPDVGRMDRFGSNPVRRLSLRRDDDNFRRDWIDNRDRRPNGFGSLSRIERDQLIVAAPSVRRENSSSLPPRVRERFDRPEIDRGWRNVGDASMTERLRDRHREELSKARSEKLPEKTPMLITSKAPPPAVGRPLRPEERRDVGQRPDPRRVDEEVRKAESPTTPGSRRPGADVTDQPPGSTRTPGSMDRDGRPGSRDGTPGARDAAPGVSSRDGTPGSARDAAPGRTPRDGTPGVRDAAPGISGREGGAPGSRDGAPGMNRDGTPGSNRSGTADVARDGTPGAKRDGPPGKREGSPGATRDGPPGSSREGVPGTASRDGDPRTPPGRAGGPTPDRNMPGQLGAGNRENLRPVPPGVVPNEGGDRRRGGAPDRPDRSPTTPPVPEPRLTPPTTPPGGSSVPESRRPGRSGDAERGPRTPAIPMPQPDAASRATPRPMPTPEAPRSRPAPMPTPQPQVRPSAPQPRAAPPSPPQQQQPQRAAPQPRSGPPGGDSGPGRGAPGGGNGPGRERGEKRDR